MINELIFFIHICFVMVFLYLSLKMGKQAFIIFLVLQILFANIFLLKQITLFSLTVTASDVYTIGAFLSLNLLQDFFGEKTTKKILYFSFYFCIFFLVMSMLHLIYLPSPFDRFHMHYEKILSVIPRIIFSSLSAYFISARLNIALFHFFSRISFFYKNILSTAISQFFDTVFFSFIALYGIMQHITHVILISFFIKLLLILFAGSFVNMIRKFHLKSQKYEV